MKDRNDCSLRVKPVRPLCNPSFFVNMLYKRCIDKPYPLCSFKELMERSLVPVFPKVDLHVKLRWRAHSSLDGLGAAHSSAPRQPLFVGVVP